MRKIANLIALIIIAICLSCESMVKETKWTISSPDNHIRIDLQLAEGRLEYSVHHQGLPIINTSSMGVVRDDADLNQGLSFLEKSPPESLNESISFLTGKQLKVDVSGVRQIMAFTNKEGKILQVEVLVFNDGLAFRYLFPEQTEQKVNLLHDATTFSIPESANGWLQPYDQVTPYTPAYERLYENGIAVGQTASYGNGWCFPALFNSGDQWLLLSESGIDGNYAGCHLDNDPGSSVYRLRWPEQAEAKNLGQSKPSSVLPWKTSWKTMAIGDLNGIVQSDIVKIINPANRLSQTSWIKPGRVSWSWLSDHPSPRNHQKLKSFIDLAAEMGWEYSLIDANWDQMEGGTVEDLVQYAKNKGVGIIMWYNSGGPHNDVTEAPRNLMHQAETRQKEFKRLQDLGVKGVKVDFFQSDKQIMMALYKEILEDAADYEILVNFHGCTIPRGWSRTYPHLITMESVRGGECYSFDDSYAASAPELNTILPFTRNVIGSMDYTPVIFSDLVTPHLTTYGHELALSVLFESGWLHFGDGVESYRSLGEVEKSFLRGVPVTWDQVELIQGKPGEEVILARRHGKTWYVAGVNGQDQAKTWSVDINRFGGNFQVTKIADNGSPDQLVATEIENPDNISVEVLPYGGFVLKLTPVSSLALN